MAVWHGVAPPRRLLLPPVRRVLHIIHVVSQPNVRRARIELWWRTPPLCATEGQQGVGGRAGGMGWAWGRGAAHPALVAVEDHGQEPWDRRAKERPRKTTAARAPFKGMYIYISNVGRRGVMSAGTAAAGVPPPSVSYATWGEGKKAVAEHTAAGANPWCVWKSVPGASEKRGRAKWTCGAHVDCKVELVLAKERGGGFSLTCSDATHGPDPPGGARR